MNILILGAGVMQIPAIKKAKELGFFVICADGNPEAVGKSNCDLFYPVDLKDKQGLLEIAENFHKKHVLNGVLTIGTDFSTSVAWVSEKLGLPGISYEVALNATDKVRMRSCFKEHNVPSPGFLEFSSEMDLGRVIKELKFPLVVKPVDNMGSRGVVKVSNLKDLESACKIAVSLSRTSRAIIEEFIDGDEFSIDALVINGEVKVFGLASRIIKFPPYFVEVGHNMPAQISTEIKDSIIEVFSRGVEALGIKHGFAKGDMKLSKDGPVIGEIAARLSGGFMSGWTYPYSSGVDLVKGAVELAVGQEISISDENNSGNFSVERGVISIPGLVKEVIHPPKKNKNVKDLFINKSGGDIVVFPTNNVEKCGSIIAAGPSMETTVKSAEGYISELIVRLEPNKVETEKFLFSKQPLRHKAFDLDLSLIEGLEDYVEQDSDKIYIKRVDKILKSRKKDWQYRTVGNVIKQLSNYYNIEFVDDTEAGYDFYKALINGSIQGVLYYLDSLEE